MDYLAYLKSYAEHNQSIGLPIMPNGVNVWISNNGKTSAVEADDISLEDGVYTICGIKCTNGTWDFSDAGQSGGGSGGGGGGGVFSMTMTQFGENQYTLDKTYAQIRSASQSGMVCIAKYFEEEEDITNTLYLDSEGNSIDESTGDFTCIVTLCNIAFAMNYTFTSDSADGVLIGQVPF
jgi:hypothetical protein